MRLRPRMVAVALALAAVTTWGWDHFWFLTDDAFIAFRYASNLVHGRGPVWNPAPFLPVEGYTSPSWVLLLTGLWSAFGCEPPATANVVGLLCSLGTLAICAAMCGRQRDAMGNRRGAGLVSIATLAAIATQPTFLTWSSSGLETPLFTLCFVAWVMLATAPSGRRTAWWSFAIALAAALTALTRPEGLLPLAATFAWLIRCAASRRLRCRALAPAVLPLAAVAAHLVWRHGYYGFWLPNTYYAKVVGLWPESGFRYLAVFAVEHGIWLWIPIVAIALLRGAAQHGVRTDHSGHLVVIAVIALTIGYYTIVVGGDHFGFRVFSVFVPLAFVAFHWACSTLRSGAAVAIGLLAAFVVSTHTIGWVASAASERTAEPIASVHGVTNATPSWLRRIVEESVPRVLLTPMADRMPRVLSGAFAIYDRWNAWLQVHYVALPRALHVAVLRSCVEIAPTREEGSRIAWDDARPVLVAETVGYFGWVLPNVAIIDGFGLNDRVIARCPLPVPSDPSADIAPIFAVLDRDRSGSITANEIPDPVGAALLTAALPLADADHDEGLDRDELAALAKDVAGRRMAHERAAPPGYIEAFLPDVRMASGTVVVEGRPRPLRDDDIRAAESGLLPTHD